jgi:hypothetical protein
MFETFLLIGILVKMAIAAAIIDSRMKTRIQEYKNGK